MSLEIAVPQEGELDRQLQALIAKIYNGSATKVEQAEYARLSKRRSELLRSDVVRHVSHLRRLRYG